MSRPVSGSPQLDADGLVLGPWRAEDAAALLAIADDPASRAWSGSMRLLHTEDDARGWIRQRADDPDRVEWAVRDPAAGGIVARVHLHRFDRD
ncbi:MAG: hypothetical protein QOH75_985, partial [Actinomycetota bacterium]|nr:hypothetical protein [Actinomycetota bacterium]